MDDVPPPYSPSRSAQLQTPPYSPSRSGQQQRSSSSTQLLTYQLRQINRKHQTLVPLGPVAVPSYSIQKNSVTGFFMKRPDITISRMSSPELIDGVVANVHLDRSSSYPWVPRATIRYEDAGTLDQHLALEDFQRCRWKVDIGGVPHNWSTVFYPTSLVLAEEQTGAIQATFIYSEYGTAAYGGQEVGQFSIIYNLQDADTVRIEQVFFSACQVISFWKDMGRAFSNSGG
jgi:hypothetical protein